MAIATKHINAAWRMCQLRGGLEDFSLKGMQADLVIWFVKDPWWSGRNTLISLVCVQNRATIPAS